MVFGLLNVNKPSGPTSHDVVAQVRRSSGQRRVGHAGTLDPLAEGVLILALGQATRLLEYLTQSHKAYDAHLTLGISTDTYDAEGAIVARRPVQPDLTPERIKIALARFRGEIEQTPPSYSAIKVKGKSAHMRMRAGEKIQLKPRQVTIYDLRLITFDPPTLNLSVVCSPGTYIRSLAHDLGEALGCGATLSGLLRTASGRFHLQDATDLETLRAAFEDGSWQRYILPADLALDGTPKVNLNQTELDRVRHGMSFLATNVTHGWARAYAPDGRLVAVLSGDSEQGTWQPKKVFTNNISHDKLP